MELEPALCYRALLSRDSRFDGRFFVGVRTTGVYCRPICPARTPKRENVQFFLCAAAAEAAGFRPCRRCRPEASPGTPAWNGTSAVVSRALRLLEDGALDGVESEALARRLGLGARHLRRLFQRHLGASPAEIARARRVHFAKALIDETVLPMATIALCAGFGSIRQFNHAILRTFARPPSELRRRRRAADSAPNGAVVLRLAYRPPLDWRSLVGFFDRRAIPGVERIDGDVYRRTIDGDSGGGTLAVSPVEGEDELELQLELPSVRSLFRIVERARRVFDLDADPQRIGAVLCHDPVLRPRVRARPGLRVPGAWDGFELAVRAILGQQVSVRAATTLAGRLVERFGRSLATTEPGLTHLFPGAEALVDADLRTIGLTSARAETIRTLARAMVAGTVRLDGACELEEAVARLAALPGIGEWTAQYIALRAFGEPDAFPLGDLGLRRALADGDSVPSTRELARIAEAWRPWRGYAAMHLWTNGAGEDDT